jgi:uncharacterized protein (DUF433 family)
MNQPAHDSLPQPSAPSLRVDEGGVVRIGKSRVGLDLVVEQYENGMTPEELVAAYDTLTLFEVYAAIAYYLEHPQEVRQYLQRRANEATELRTQVEADRPAVSRAELLSRRTNLV